MPSEPSSPDEPDQAPPGEPALSEFANPDVEIDQRVEPRTRFYPSTVGGFAYLFVVAATGYGLYLAWTGDWRTGVRWVGAAMLLDAAFRLVLPEKQTGMLHVRRRLVDVVVLTVLGVALLVVAETISG